MIAAGNEHCDWPRLLSVKQRSLRQRPLLHRQSVRGQGQWSWVTFPHSRLLGTHPPPQPTRASVYDGPSTREAHTDGLTCPGKHQRGSPHQSTPGPRRTSFFYCHCYLQWELSAAAPEDQRDMWTFRGPVPRDQLDLLNITLHHANSRVHGQTGPSQRSP